MSKTEIEFAAENAIKLGDLISRSALLEKSNGYTVCLFDIRHAPAVDAVEVVRCGLCKHWDVEELYCHHPAGLSFCGNTGAQKGFCCFGERRDGDAID